MATTRTSSNSAGSNGTLGRSHPTRTREDAGRGGGPPPGKPGPPSGPQPPPLPGRSPSPRPPPYQSAEDHQSTTVTRRSSAVALHHHHHHHSDPRPMANQVAGHGSQGGGRGAILKRPADGLLLKPLQAPPKGQRELAFYTGLAESDDPVDLRLRGCVPEFFGVERRRVPSASSSFSAEDVRPEVADEFLVLRDVTEGFEMPTVMDVKIGSRTWGPDASDKKRQQEDSKYVGTKHPFGFSVLGCIVHSLVDDEAAGGGESSVVRKGKDFGMQLRTEQAHLIPEVFFDVARSGKDAGLECSKIVADKIAQVLEAFKGQLKYRIYGSSLLMAYDAGAVRRFRKGSLTRDQLCRDFVNVKLIDFAHAFPSDEGQPDENFVRGLTNLLALFRAYAEGHDHPKNILKVNGIDR